MVVKKETKKKQGQRGKSKSIINPKKDTTLKQKEEIVEELEKKLPDEKEEKKHNPKGGRNTVMTANTIDKLKLCFSVGMTDAQACYFCQISTDVLYKYQRENPEFIKEKKILKESITMQARVNVGRSIKIGNVTDSWKWLEKKDPSFRDVMKVEQEIDIGEKSRKLLKKLALE